MYWLEFFLLDHSLHAVTTSSYILITKLNVNLLWTLLIHYFAKQMVVFVYIYPQAVNYIVYCWGGFICFRRNHEKYWSMCGNLSQICLKICVPTSKYLDMMHTFCPPLHHMRDILTTCSNLSNQIWCWIQFSVLCQIKHCNTSLKEKNHGTFCNFGLPENGQLGLSDK